MNQRDAFSEELLSGCLDGQLTPDEQLLVEQALAEDPKLRRRLHQLRTLSTDLGQLPRQRLDGIVAERILRVVRTALENGAAGALEPGPEELLSAYLDGELSAELTQRVEGELAADASRRRELQDLRSLCEAFRSLPRHHLDEGFTERVLRRAKREMGGDAGDRETAPVTPASIEKRRGTASWRRVVGPVLATAAMILVAVGGFVLREGKTARSMLPPDSPLKFASGMKDLLLVYEVAVTADDVGRAAFANLLRQNGITFRNTVPVGPREHDELLGNLYLRGAVKGDADREDVDEIELYFVSCRASQADAVYTAAMQRPQGLASFLLNLTQMDRKGPLQRLGDRTRSGDRIGEAIQLAGKFRILSRQGRCVGAFGKIQVDPRLYEPAVPDAAAPPVAQATPDADGDFRCELLFVVRFLKPVEEKDGE